MQEYEQMYYTLFNKISDVIKELQEIQCKTEELYMNCCESSSTSIDKKTDKL